MRVSGAAPNGRVRVFCGRSPCGSVRFWVGMAALAAVRGGAAAAISLPAAVPCFLRNHILHFWPPPCGFGCISGFWETFRVFCHRFPCGAVRFRVGMAALVAV